MYLIVIFSILLHAARFTYGYRNYSGYSILKALPSSEEDIVKLHELEFNDRRWDIDFWSEVTYPGQGVDIMVSPVAASSVTGYLNQTGVAYKTAVNDVQKLIDETVDPEFRRRRRRRRIGRLNTNRYHSYDEINRWMADMARQHDTVKYITIGKSHERRNMKLLKIGTKGHNKPGFFIDAGIHAREWIAPAVALYIADQLISGYYNGDKLIKDLVERLDFFILPLVNPDGYEYSRKEDRAWRKTTSGKKKDCVGRAARDCCFGVDINRNFPYKYGGVYSASHPCDNSYRGRRAFSEVESRNMGRWLRDNRRRIHAYITLHSYGQWWVYPYGYDYHVDSSDAAELKELAEKVTSELKRLRGTIYDVGNAAHVIYPASGTSDDWAKSIGIKYVYCIELPPSNREQARTGYGFMLPDRYISPVGRETWIGLRMIAERVADEYAPTTTPASTTQAITTQPSTRIPLRRTKAPKARPKYKPRPRPTQSSRKAAKIRQKSSSRNTSRPRRPTPTSSLRNTSRPRIPRPTSSLRNTSRLRRPRPTSAWKNKSSRRRVVPASELNYVPRWASTSSRSHKKSTRKRTKVKHRQPTGRGTVRRLKSVRVRSKVQRLSSTG